MICGMDARKTTPRTTRIPLLEKFKFACEQANLPYTSGRDAVHRGELKIVYIGRSWYVDVEDFVAWIESRKGAA
jgi:hypothetical protein